MKTVRDIELGHAIGFMNIALGTAIIIISLDSYFKSKTLVPVYIMSAIIIAGPLEDILMKLVKPEDRWIVDQITSIGFLIFLLLAVIESAEISSF